MEVVVAKLWSRLSPELLWSLPGPNHVLAKHIAGEGTRAAGATGVHGPARDSPETEGHPVPLGVRVPELLSRR